ncbi:MAG: dual OB domain-containing protein [Planctomycetota bacterium]|jgi:hypothetical protein
MAQIACLANSYKGGGQRCIAGIDLSTGEWVRPVNPQGHEGAIGDERLIKGNEPQILDVLDIPIGVESEDYGCQPENKILLPGRWTKIGTISAEDALKYVDHDSFLLHNHDKKVDSEYFKSIPKERWKLLQLIEVRNTRFDKNPWGKWECNFRYYGRYYELKLTDPEVIDRLDAGEEIARRCILTISLTTPFAYEEDPKQCWKLVAGVVEL